MDVVFFEIPDLTKRTEQWASIFKCHICRMNHNTYFDVEKHYLEIHSNVIVVLRHKDMVWIKRQYVGPKSKRPKSGLDITKYSIIPPMDTLRKTADTKKKINSIPTLVKGNGTQVSSIKQEHFDNELETNSCKTIKREPDEDDTDSLLGGWGNSGDDDRIDCSELADDIEVALIMRDPNLLKELSALNLPDLNCDLSASISNEGSSQDGDNGTMEFTSSTTLTTEVDCGETFNIAKNGVCLAPENGYNWNHRHTAGEIIKATNNGVEHIPHQAMIQVDEENSQSSIPDDDVDIIEVVINKGNVNFDVDERGNMKLRPNNVPGSTLLKKHPWLKRATEFTIGDVLEFAVKLERDTSQHDAGDSSC